ncbi:LANO_0C07228g1_1 [Lachancea nothofagi CBS 11611]|uniref:LANO_0C07228g1_1 n=1 Tax=Lachancea nothofagi CBS 11611 TaxID=1266666 RepID=A0A1G4J908_9SACH|nr:LANO_0C07228g1_1 [Lachancea nothofagi CBS 11611]
MLMNLPVDIWDGVAQYLTQEDKVSLTYVSSSVRFAILPILYRNLFLNEKPCMHSDSDPLLGNYWSVLNIQEARYEDADRKLAALIRTLSESPLLASYLDIVHCTWHLDVALLKELLEVLVRQAGNLRQFRNFLRMELVDELKALGPQLHALDLPPPAVLPQKRVSSLYLSTLAALIPHYSFENVTYLNIYMDPGLFFSNYAPNAPKLRLRELGLSLRGDTYDASCFKTSRLTYSDVFDTRYLEKLTILSWYETDDVDIYEKYHLFELLEFVNLRELTFMSFFANDDYLRHCLQTFTQLRRLKLDYMFGHTIKQGLIELLAQSPESQTLQYLDIKFRQLDPYLVTVNHGSVSYFEINETCICSSCHEVLQNIIYRKIFPTQSSLHIKSFEDVPKRDIITRIISVSPIVPYTQFVDSRPGLSFVQDPVEDDAQIINKALGKSVLTAGDIIKVYHAHLHSLKRTFNYFLQRFPNLKFLNVNDVPTSVNEGPGGQRYNEPVYNGKGYHTNQVYEVIDDESLFD